jgi:hypothetical protein
MGITAQPLTCKAWLCSGLRAASGSSQRARGVETGCDFTVLVSCSDETYQATLVPDLNEFKKHLNIEK